MKRAPWIHLGWLHCYQPWGNEVKRYQDDKTQKLKTLERNQTLHCFISFTRNTWILLSLSLSLSLSHSSYCYYIYTAAAYIREQRDWLCVRERAGETYIFFSGERVKGTSKTKRATEVHGDERDDKAGGRIKLLTWVLPSLISPFVTLYIKILLLFTTCCACSFLLSCLYIYIYIYIYPSFLFPFLDYGVVYMFESWNYGYCQSMTSCLASFASLHDKLNTIC
jgi:hypothetical protein